MIAALLFIFFLYFLSILQRCTSVKLLKGPVKITHILISHLFRNGIHRHIHVFEHLFSGQHPLLLDIFDKALAGVFFRNLLI